jgi:molybdate transport system substrate-binding protein
MKRVLYTIIIVLLFSGCTQKKKSSENELVVFCAASLTDVISELTSAFEKENHVQVKMNLASSGALARQIEHGADPAIFISANKKWLDYLNKLGKTIPEFEKRVAGNSMVLVAPIKSTLDSFPFSPEINIPDLFKGRVSIGDPQYVPAGSYALQLLQKLGWANELGPRFLKAKDVRSALMVVELGEVEAGIVYKTDALKSKKVKIITEFPDSTHEPVAYYMSLIQGQKNQNSLDLYNYILSDSAKIIWKQFGFIQ